MDETPNQGSDQGPPTPDDAARQPDESSSAERRLIEAALEGAEPASGWPESTQAWFEGAPLPPHGAFPGYDIVREIHRGGQGVVYQAVQLSTRRHVAIKVMHSGPFMGSSGRARFEREVQVLGQLDHPNIVGIHDSGVTTDGSCFYVMDYISGKPLDRLMEEGQLPIRESLRLFAKICDAVAAAHLKGVIHRDLKPSNIRIDKHGEPIVVDFGLAKLAIPDLDAEGSGRLMSMTGQFIGSLPWASPEQADGSPTNIDVRTDVYSLGVILYQLLTNRFPYEVLGNMRDVLDNIVRVEPARPSTIRRKINDEVETIVLKALAKQRERRYQSAGELGRDVHRFLDGQPIEAKRDSGWYVISKTLKRYRVPVALGAGGLAALVVFAVVVSVLYSDAEAARGVAEEKTVEAQRLLEAEAEQRARAEARLAAVFDLTETMTTVFYDAVVNLRGGTPAKLSLAERAVAALDQFEDDVRGDPVRTLQIGRGRLRLGDLYAGRRDLHRIGKPEEGQALYASALSLADAVLADEPGSVTAMHLRADALTHLGHAARLMREFERSVELYEQSLAAFDKAIDAPPDTDELLGKLRLAHADALLELGNSLIGQALRSDDADQRSRLNARAESTYERGRTSFDRLSSQLEGLQRNRARLGASRAQVRLALMRIRASEASIADPGQADRGLEAIDRAVALLASANDTLQSLAEAEPANGVYPSDMGVAYDAWGQALRQRARLYEAMAGEAAGEDAAEPLEQARIARRDAVAILTDGIDIIRRSINADDSDVAFHRTLAHLLNKRARALDALEESRQAEQDFVESAGVRDMLADTDPTGQHLNDAMVGWYYVGVFREGQADETGEETTLREALAAFERARGYIEQQQQAGMSTDNGDLTTIDARIKAVRDKLSSG
ncbi:MAG: protein kinase [Phycisphaerales bacterium]|jgi:tetratricopeptide (TPR) repeat protein/predicted Ser/Thr protein kinase